jgi:penicillin-binding protein 1B
MSSPRKKTAPQAKRKNKKKRKRPAGRLRILIAAGIFLMVLAGGYILHLYVSVTTGFDGRLWALPSRIYSDVLVLERGSRLSRAQLSARLSRSGYALLEERPRKPGQFSILGAQIEIFLRGFSAPTDNCTERRVTVTFSGERVRSVLDGQGRPARRVVVEPELLATLYGPRHEERELVRLEAVPTGFRKALLAAEDSRFYRHNGLDLRGMARAGMINLREGGIVQGGSTITQQTVKNIFLGQERTWWRKGREILMSLILDGSYSKDRILEVYLNEVYLGQRGSVAICGAQAASRFYFGRALDELALSEWALLAGLIRSPGSYNPFSDRERAIARRDQVLKAMHRLEMIDGAALERATDESLQLASGGGGYPDAPYAVDFVRAQLAKRYPRRALMEEGLIVYTTIDTRLQQRAEESLKDGLKRLERERSALRRQAGEPELQGAIVATHPSSGAIVAMVGGRDYGRSQFNRIVQAKRQPGSCFKPFVFAGGFEAARARRGKGLTPATMLDDSALELRSGGKMWSPSNYDGTYRGAVSVRRALEESLNVPTVRAALHIGLDKVIVTARACGIDSPLPELPSLALGAAEVTPLELATAYGAFSQRGIRVTPWIIRAVTDRDGNRLVGRGVERRRAVSSQTAYQIDDILHGVFERGTARSAYALGFSGIAAGKTGTTDETRDSWFVGYGADLLALVWVGYDDNARTGLTGATGALPIWVRFMRSEIEPFGPGLEIRPHGMVRVLIDPESGELAGPNCPSVREEWFAPGTEPSDQCRLHRGRFRRWLRRILGKEPRNPAI